MGDLLGIGDMFNDFGESLARPFENMGEDIETGFARAGRDLQRAFTEQPVAALEELGGEEQETPAGIFQVQVRVVEARGLSGIKHFSLNESVKNLKLATSVASDDRLPHAYVRVVVDKGDGSRPQKQKTEVRPPSATPLWDSLMYFDDIAVAKGELAACTIMFQVWDRHRIGGHELIGVWETDLESIYSLPGHEMWRVWMPLVDAFGKRGGIQGHLMLCATVLGANDELVLHDVDDDMAAAEEGDGDDLSLLLGSNMQSYMLKISLYKAVDLPRMDRFGSGIDAYVRLACGSAKPAESRVQSRLDPVWNQEVALTIRVPQGMLNAAPPVRFSVLDMELGATDEHVCSLRLSLPEVLKEENRHKFSRPRWYPLYGAPRGMELKQGPVGRLSKLAKKMNAGFIEGSGYRGRVLMSIEAGDESKMDLPRRKITLPSDFQNDERMWLLSEVIAVELVQPEEGPGIKVAAEVGFGLESTQSSYKKLLPEAGTAKKDAYVDINERLKPMPVMVPPPFNGEGSNFSVFVNVLSKGRLGADKEHRLGFVRIPLKDLFPHTVTRKPTDAPEGATGGDWSVQGWFKLSTDALSRKRGSTSARSLRPCGSVLVRLQLQQRDKDDDITKQIVQEEERAKLLGPKIKKSKAAKRRAKNKKKLAKARGLDVDSSDSSDDPDASQKRDFATRMLAKVGGSAIVTAKEIRRLEMKTFVIRISLFQARGLPPADPEGTSDPYAIVRVGRYVSQTQVIRKTLSPGWFAEIELTVDLPVCAQEDTTSFSAMLRQFGDGEGRRKKAAKPEGKPLPLPKVIENAVVRPTTEVEEMRPDRAHMDAVSYAPSTPAVQEQGGGHVAVNVEGAQGLAAVGTSGGDSGAAGTVGGGDDQRVPAQPDLVYSSDEMEEDDEDRVKPGDILWWAAPEISITVSDADKIGADDPLSHTRVSLLQDSEYWTQSYNEDIEGKVYTRRPVWMPLDTFNPPKPAIPGLVSGGDILLGATVLEVPDVSSHELQDALAREKKRLNIANFGGEDVKIAGFTCGVAETAEVTGGPGVSGLDIEKDSVPVKVQLLVCGVRNLEGYFGTAPSAPWVEFELSGALALHMYPHLDDDEITDRELEAERFAYSARTDESSYPTGANANFGESIELFGGLPTLKGPDGIPLCKPFINVRVFDRKLGRKILIGTATLPLDVPDLSDEKQEEETAMQLDRDDSDDDDDDAASIFTGSTASTQHTYSESNWTPGKSMSKTTEFSLPSTIDEISEMDEDERKEADGNDGAKFGDTPPYLIGRYELGLVKDEDGVQEKGEYEENKELLKKRPFLTVPLSRCSLTDSIPKKVGMIKLQTRVVPVKVIMPSEVQPEEETPDADATALGGFGIGGLPSSLSLNAGVDAFASGLTNIGAGGAFGPQRSKVHPVTLFPLEDKAPDPANMVKLSRLLRRRQQVVVRVYVIQGIDLRPLDAGGKSDPYLIVKLGNRSQGSRQDYREQTLQPPFYQTFEFRTELPGASQLTLQVFDYDEEITSIGDDFIGETTIDLEDRWFNDEWHSCMPKPPLEKRQLFNKKSPNRQGFLELWVELWRPEDAAMNKIIKIKPPPPLEVEMRVVVWQARYMEAKDTVTLQNDLFFKLTVEGIDTERNVKSIKKETDTHWLAASGKGSFNFRLVFHFDLPLYGAKLKVSGWDFDILTNDVIGEAEIDLKKELFDEFLEQYKELDKKGEGKNAKVAWPKVRGLQQNTSKWVKLYHPKNASECKGEVQMQIQLLTREGADQRPVGEGRDEPNRDPFLPEADREKLNLLDPFASLRMLVGPERLRQILVCLCIGLAVLVGAFFLILIINDLISALIDSLF